jgi:hypothetical protein
MKKDRSRGRVEVAVRFKRHGSGSRCAEAKTPAPTDAGVSCHRHTFDQVIPRLDARQQSQPPFHLARRTIPDAHESDKSVLGLPVWKTGKSVAKEALFLVQTMGSGPRIRSITITGSQLEIQREVTMRRLLTTLLPVLLFAGCSSSSTTASKPKNDEQDIPNPAIGQKNNPPVVTITAYNLVAVGMTIQQVEEILGAGRDVTSDIDRKDGYTVYRWTDLAAKAGINVTFVSGKVQSKLSVGTLPP